MMPATMLKGTAKMAVVAIFMAVVTAMLTVMMVIIHDNTE